MKLRECLWFVFGLVVAGAVMNASVGAWQDQGEKPAVATAAKIKEVLAKPVTLDHSAPSIFDAVQYLREKTGLSFRTDGQALMMVGITNEAPFIQPGIPAPPPNPAHAVHIHATKLSLDQAIRRAIQPLGLTFVVLEDAILITTDGYGPLRQMRQRVQVDVVDKPFRQAVKELAAKTGITLVIDPRASKQASQKVTLEIDNAGVETSIRLLAELVDLKAVRMNDLLFITDSARAAKIRGEETPFADHFGGPINPAVDLPAMRGGLFGGGVGGVIVAEPAVDLPAPLPKNVEKEEKK